MNKYIDAEKLKAEIERRKNEWKALIDKDNAVSAKTIQELICEDLNILDIISSLQQEQPKPFSCSHENGYDEAYLQEKIAKASKTWKGVDVDKYLDEVRGREPELSGVDLEKAIDEYFGDGGQWKSGFCVGKKGFLKIARHFYELGTKARKEN